MTSPQKVAFWKGNGTPYFRKIQVDETLFHLARYMYVCIRLYTYTREWTVDCYEWVGLLREVSPVAVWSRNCPSLLRCEHQHTLGNCTNKEVPTGTATIDGRNPKQPPNMYETMKPCKWWDFYHMNWLAGFLPSRVAPLYHKNPKSFWV